MIVDVSRTWSILLCVGLAVVAAVLLSGRLRLPESAPRVSHAWHAALTNETRRLDAAGPVHPRMPTRSASLPDLPVAERVSVPALRLADVPDLQLDRDPDMGTPRFVRRRSTFLSQAMPAATPTEAASAFIEANGKTFTLHPTDIQPPNARVTRDVTTRHNGMRSLTWQQQKGGIEIFGATFMLNLTADSRVINVSSRALHMPSVRFHDVVNIAKQEAIKTAMVYVEGERPREPAHPPPSTVLRPPSPIWYPLDMISVVKAWDLTVEGVFGQDQQDGQDASVHGPASSVHRLLIRADTGEVVEDMNLTWNAIELATFNVYTNDSPEPCTPGPDAPTNYVPVGVPRDSVTLACLDTNASPNGWVTAGENGLVGNNANVYADWDDNDSPDSPTVTGTSYRVFSYSLDLTDHPTNYVQASQVQAFYMLNLFHDRLWLLGFDEAAGNFQSSNFGRGGVGGDPIKVEVQNGGLLGFDYVNEAWYQGWGDGSQCKVSISVFARSDPHRCGILDGQLLVHEFAHGVSTRLIGNGFGLTSVPARGLGEGWSDFFALALLAEPGDDPDGCYPIATYAAIYQEWSEDLHYYGVRRFPYSTDMTKAPQTIADIDPNQIDFPPGVPRNPRFGSEEADQMHNIGEVWCLMLWECRANLIEEYGFAGNESIMRLVVDGMKLSPVNPTFIEARDAVLQADMVNSGGVNQIALWKGFAKRGLGYSSWVPGSSSTVGIIEGYDLPFTVNAQIIELGGDGDGYVEPGEDGELTVVLHSHEMALSNLTAVLSVMSSNVTVTASNAVLPTIEIGGTSTSAPPFAFSIGAGFAGNTDAQFTLSIDSDQGWFDEPLALRIGNPYDYAPEIMDVAVAELGETNASIAWNTGIPADGLVQYGLSTNYGLATALDPVMRTNHIAHVTGLTKGTEYHYRVVSEGTNGLTAYSADHTFRTRERVYVYAGSTATQELGTIEAPFRSLQAAAEAAKLYGDDILVAEGTYTSAQVEAVLDLDGSDWDLTIEGGYCPNFSARDPDTYVMTIDGQRSRRGIRLDNGAKLAIRGITITRGQGQWGGGVHVRKSEWSAVHCVIVENSSTNVLNDIGGGVYGTLGSSLVMRACIVVRNVAREGGGGFLVSNGTTLDLSNCTLSDNTGFYDGGGLRFELGAVGNVTCSGFFGNAAEHQGAGIVVAPFCSVGIGQSTFSSNVVWNAHDPYFMGGGGVLVAGVSSAATLWIQNSIVHGNTSQHGGDLRCGSRSDVHAIHCNIGDIYGTLDTSNNVFSADPLFANPNASDFHLLYGSPCIDAGMTNYGGGTVDMDGELRPFGAAIDIGADEFTDVDDDQMADYWESDTFGSITNSDGTSDGDADELDDFGEYMAQTDPFTWDTDNDTMPDGWEVGHNLEPLVDDAALDPDLDTMPNDGEYVSDTDPQDGDSVLQVLGVDRDAGGMRLDWKGGREAWQFVEISGDLLDSNTWEAIYGRPPSTPITNAVIIFGLTNDPVYFRIRAKRE